MGKVREVFRTLAVMILVMCAICPAAFAAETEKETITEVNLEIEAYLEDAESSGDVSVSTGDTTYRIGNIEVLNENEDWSEVSPKISVDLKAKKGYRFGRADEEMFSFEGDEVSFVSAKVKNSGSALTLIFTLGSDEDDLSVHGLFWNEEDRYAEWEENENARAYQVKLYRNHTMAGTTHTTKNSYYDFSEATSGNGRYYFMVRALGKGSECGPWETSEIWQVLDEEDQDLTGGVNALERPLFTGQTSRSQENLEKAKDQWKKDKNGWWYQYADGNYPRDGWAEIGGKWYFFDENGYIRTGWILYKNRWYYCEKSGAMLSSAVTPDGYSVGADGAWNP